MLDLGDKPVRLFDLAREMDAAGVAHRGLGLVGDRWLHTYDEQGAAADLPDEALPVVAAHDPSIYDAAEAQARTFVRTLAATAVGVRFDQLTAAQVRALLAVLFWRAGALTPTGHVRPLGQWARDVDD